MSNLAHDGCEHRHHHDLLSSICAFDQRIWNRARLVADVDITSGDDSVKKLAELTATRFKVRPMSFEDGHYQMTLGQVKFDFSSNFVLRSSRV